MNYNKLISYIESVKSKPFEWGKHDCCLFASGALLAATGVDFMAEFRGKYNSLETALVALRKEGKNTLHKTMVSKFGKPIPAAQASRGAVMFRLEKLHGPSLGICAGTMSYFVSDDGLVPIPTLECVSAWVR